jgi:hypothetical protein
MKLASLIPPPGTNKYELCIIAAREARRMNEWARQTGQTTQPASGKSTVVALDHTIRHEVPFYYEEPLAP